MILSSPVVYINPNTPAKIDPTFRRMLDIDEIITNSRYLGFTYESNGVTYFGVKDLQQNEASASNQPDELLAEINKINHLKTSGFHEKTSPATQNFVFVDNLFNGIELKTARKLLNDNHILWFSSEKCLDIGISEVGKARQEIDVARQLLKLNHLPVEIICEHRDIN